MTKYAESTTVSSEKSKGEIETTLRRYGADQFLYGWQLDKAVIGFVARGRQVRFLLPMPDRASREFTHTPGRGYERKPAEADAAFEQAVRQRWRALALVIKAKLESVETGITTFEQEFLAHTMLPSGSTVSEWIDPQITQAYKTGEMPALLPALGPGS